MKKIFTILLCVVLLLAFSTVAFAEEVVTEVASGVRLLDILSNPSVDGFLLWAEANYEKLAVVFGLILSALFSKKNIKKLLTVITTLNNNSVSVAENSTVSIEDMKTVVKQYKDSMESMLDEIRRNHEERVELETSLTEVSKYLKATRLANTELANEVAELLILANIPNSKKDELYARHLAAVNSIAEAEKAVEAEEVKENEETNEE